jgi:hypothetical protein
MSQEERAQPAITSLPRVEDIPVAPEGYDQQRVQDAFEAFRRHVVQLQAQLRVLQAAGHGGQVDPSGHAVRMDARNEARQLLAESPGDAGAPRGRGAWRAAARVGASPGDRTDELGPRRGRADARVGPRAGDRDHGLSSAGCRAVPLGRRSRRRRDFGRVRGRSSGPRPATSKVLVHTSCQPGRSLSPPPPSPAARPPSLRLRTRATRTTPTRDSVSS